MTVNNAQVFDQALEGGGAKNINFQELAADLAQITFDYPFRIPPYFALIIRAISVLEGIALVGDPDFAIVDEAYPYVAKRLLTDKSPRLQAALKYMVRIPGPTACSCMRGAHPTGMHSLAPASLLRLPGQAAEASLPMQTHQKGLVQGLLCHVSGTVLRFDRGFHVALMHRSALQHLRLALHVLLAVHLMSLTKRPFTCKCFGCVGKAWISPDVKVCAAPCVLQIYGKEDTFDADRLIDLLGAFETFREASQSARGNMDGDGDAFILPTNDTTRGRAATSSSGAESAHRLHCKHALMPILLGQGLPASAHRWVTEHADLQI